METDPRACADKPECLGREDWQRKQVDGKDEASRDLTLTIPAFKPKTDLLNPVWTLKFMHFSG